MSFLKSVSKGFSSVGSILNDITGVSDSTAQQRKMAQEQNAYNTYMWNLANQYNTPAAQLARMKEAGIDINPTSYALGTGNLSNTAGTVTAGSGFVGSPAGNPISMAMGVAQGITGIKEAKQRIANMKEQNINLMEQGNILFNNMEGSRLSNEIARHNLQYAQKHGTPVNAMPNLQSSLVGVGNEVLTAGRKLLGI